MSKHTEESISPDSRPEQFIGSRVQRTEDQLLLKGQGQYVDDLKLNTRIKTDTINIQLTAGR